MNTPPQQILCGVFLAALMLSGCATSRTAHAPDPAPEIVEPIVQSSGDPLYDLIRYAFVEQDSARIQTLLDSVAYLLPERFVPAPIPKTKAAKRLTGLTRVTLERYHAILPRTAIPTDTPLATLLNTLPDAVVADLFNHPHYRELKIRTLAGQADVPIDFTPEVMAYIQFFRTEGSDFFGRWLSRSTAYLPMIQPILRENGLPQDLAYKAMIESGFNPRARSHASAVGMWQFMRGTGYLYGLRSNTWTDDRMDPDKATPAAAKHLKRLYRHFKDWRLVVAAYNCGQGRMDRAIKDSKTRDFWKIDSLPRETRNHLPKFMAAVLITKDPAFFGFEDIAYQPPLSFDEVVLKEPVALRLAAQCAGTTYEWMRQLNPELRRAYTPPTTRKSSYTLRVPKGMAARFKANYARVPASKKIQMVEYRVKRRDTISGIALRYNISQRALKDANGIRDPRYLRIGRKINIPLHPDVRTQLAAMQKNNVGRKPDPQLHRKATVVVRSGDSLWQIARREGTTVTHLRAWNNLAANRPIHPGQKLAVWVPKSGMASNSFYTVRLGDTLWDIARAFDTSIEDLKSWNDILSPSSLRAGVRIRVREAEIAE